MITIDTDAWQKANKEQIDALTKTVAELREAVRKLRHFAACIASESFGKREAFEVLRMTDQFEAALASPPAAEEPSTKGCYGAECNRASCKNVPATWKHRDIPRHYCQPCGMWINENNSDCDPPLCGPAAGDAT